MIPMTCRNCMWFTTIVNRRHDEPSDFGCRQANWAGYIIHPDKSECGGVAFVAAKFTSAPLGDACANCGHGKDEHDGGSAEDPDPSMPCENMKCICGGYAAPAAPKAPERDDSPHGPCGICDVCRDAFAKNGFPTVAKPCHNGWPRSAPPAAPKEEE